MGLCCCDLKTGVMVLAILSIIGSVITIVAPLPNLNNELREYKFKEPDLYHYFVTAVVIGFIINGIWLIIGILLLVGAVQRNAGMCTVYLIGNPILYFLTIGLIIFSWGNEPRRELKVYIGGAIGILIGTAFTIYFFLVVHAFIKEIREGPPPGMMVLDPQYGMPYPGEGQFIQYGGNPSMLQQSPSGQMMMNQGVYAPMPNQTPSQHGQVTMNQGGYPAQPVGGPVFQ